MLRVFLSKGSFKTAGRLISRFSSFHLCNELAGNECSSMQWSAGCSLTQNAARTCVISLLHAVSFYWSMRRSNARESVGINLRHFAETSRCIVGSGIHLPILWMQDTHFCIVIAALNMQRHRHRVRVNCLSSFHFIWLHFRGSAPSRIDSASSSFTACSALLFKELEC